MIDKILKKRIKGHVTVFAALTFIVVSTLIITIIFFSIYCATVVRIDYASALAQESAFAGFTNHIFNKYGIFVLKDTVSVYNRRKEVLLNNIKDGGASLTDMYLTDTVYMTDGGGEPFYDQAVSYMKSEALVDYGKQAFMGFFNGDTEKDLNKMADLATEIRNVSDDMEEESITEAAEKISEKFSKVELTDVSNKNITKGIENDINGSFTADMKDEEPVLDEEKSEAFNNAKNILKVDLTSLVVGDKVSSKEFNKSNWEMNEKIMNKSIDTGEGADAAVSRLLFEEYLFLKFNSYIDVNNAGAKSDGLEYGLEYIVGGRKSDRENLDEVLKRLSLIREGSNIIFLMTDPESMAQIEMLALMIFGFTLNPVIITIGKYAIMAAWAYAEAIVDLKLLMNDKKVPLVKTKATWNLSLESFLGGKLVPTGRSGETGLNYETYLRMLIYPQQVSNQCARAMDLMEIEMIHKGQDDFRMRNCIFAQNMHAEFSLPYGGKRYVRNYDYAYGKINQ